MDQKNKIKLALHRFTAQWKIDEQKNRDLGIQEFDARIGQSEWLPLIRTLPEQDRLDVLRSAFITDPPKEPLSRSRSGFTRFGIGRPQPTMAFLVGRHCLDTHETMEELFEATILQAQNGRWLEYAIEYFGPRRTIDLIYQYLHNSQHLSLMLYDVERILLSSVNVSDREAVILYYIDRKMEAFRQKLLLTSNSLEAEIKFAENRLRQD